MKKLQNIFSRISIPKKDEVRKAIQTFSKGRKFIFLFFLGLFFVSGIALFAQLLLRPFQIEIPTQGGIHTEGVIGKPRFVNPVLSISNADKDVESLVFAGLTRKTRDGSIVLDLADDFSVSEDNLVYTFKINPEARFHDNAPVTASDVVYTIHQIQNPEIKSPKRAIWEGITVEALDDQTVRFKLDQPFISFLENTSVGILPSHIWEEVPDAEFSFSPLNIKAIGAGKYKITGSTKSSGGSLSSYTLKIARQYTGKKPFIKKFKIRFFEDEEAAVRALKSKDIEALAEVGTNSIENIPKDTTIYTATLHRTFGLFFNQDTSQILQDVRVRRAISLAIDRQAVVDEVLDGFGQPIQSPLPTTIKTNVDGRDDVSQNIARAQSLLDQANWTMQSNGIRQKNGTNLHITIKTANIPDLENTADLIASQLHEIGIDATVQTMSMNDLNQTAIRPRNFEVLLFGQAINQESDIFAFWHGSQISDPGLNISGYKNSKVDKALENAIQTFDQNKRASFYSTFEKEFFNDVPAVFIYSPQLVYVVRGKLHNVELSPITNSSERLLDMQDWYSETDYFIKAFQK